MNGGPAPPADPPVQSIGRYALVAELGRGGTANIFLAVPQGEPSARPVVLKVLRAYDEDRELRRMFVNEGQLALRLQHPNVVRTSETGHHGKQAFLVMEHLEGRPLSKMLGPASDVPLPLPLTLLALADALDGLHYAHELCDPHGAPYKIVHRDVSPHNIFITYDGEVKVLDFGAAKFADATAATAVGAIKGRLRYMAPEQAAGRALDRRADLFSMGIVLWQAMTGRQLWGDLDDATVVTRLLRGDIPSPGPPRGDVTPNLLAICRRALASAPERRYETAAAFSEALRGELKRHGERGSREALRTYVTARFAAEKERADRVVDVRLRQLSTAATPSAGTACPSPPPAPRRRDLALSALAIAVPATGIALLASLLLVRPQRAADDPERPAPPASASASLPSPAAPAKGSAPAEGAAPDATIFEAQRTTRTAPVPSPAPSAGAAPGPSASAPEPPAAPPVGPAAP